MPTFSKLLAMNPQKQSPIFGDLSSAFHKKMGGAALEFGWKLLGLPRESSTCFVFYLLNNYNFSNRLQTGTKNIYLHQSLLSCML